jgi:malonyl CoA-acyl carrier protein transacylase
METLLEECGCDFFIELGPGNVLAGLLRRISTGVEVISVGDSASVRACAEKLRAG